MPDDDLHVSRPGASHFGKLTADVKTRLSEDEKADLMGRQGGGDESR